MTEKRFKDIEVGIDGNIRLYSDDINYNTYFQEEIIDLLNEQDQEIQKYKDAFYKAHQQQEDTMKELSKIKKERDEAIFKQKTLEKWYTCPTCGYNNKEIEYLKSLKK